MEARGDAPTRWRGKLRRDVAVLMALKIAALALLWALFSSPAARVAVDGAGASRQLGLTHRQAAPPPASLARPVRPVSVSTP
jgi:hypothetical protein